VTTALLFVGVLYLLWLGFVFTMHIKAQWDKLPLASKILGAPPAVLAYLLDVAVNWFVATVVFLDLPREATLTHRLQRYKHGWRRTVARFVCEQLLNPFDPDHC
jgi:hypothetical protein